jgi:radical SAM protein with 4Fe4S-binding SPASM domain
VTKPRRVVRSAVSQLAARLRANGTLVSVQIELTSRCPLACAHCYNDPTEPDLLDLERLKSIFAEAASLGALFVTFTGGEIYSRPDLHEIIAEARRQQYVVRLQTSGWYLDEPRADFVAAQAVAEVQLSVYSADPSVHDAVTGRPGSHARAVAAARALRQRRVRVALAATVTSLNASTYRSVEQLAKELDCGHTMDATIMPCESGARGPCGLRPATAVLRDFYGDYARSQFQAGFPRPAGADALRGLDEAPCNVGSTFVVIASDGTAYPCMPLRVPLGNVTREPLAVIWRESSERRRLRELTWGDLPACSQCSLRDYCPHCLALALAEHGDIVAPPLENCRHALVRRDLLREDGLIPASETALPPPLATEELDGARSSGGADPPQTDNARSSSSRVGR